MEEDLDGIKAWIELRRIYDNGGSVDLHVSAIDDDVRKPYTTSFPGGLTGYIERYQALTAEMETIAPTKFTDDRKQCLLVKNIRRSSDRVAYLAQHRTDNNFSYDKAASYLAKNAIIHDQDTANAPKRVMTVKNSTEEESEWLTMDATTLLFAEATRESSLFTAYQSFNKSS